MPQISTAPDSELPVYYMRPDREYSSYAASVPSHHFCPGPDLGSSESANLSCALHPGRGGRAAPPGGSAATTSTQRARDNLDDTVTVTKSESDCDLPVIASESQCYDRTLPGRVCYPGLPEARAPMAKLKI